MGQGWNPWAALRERRHLLFLLANLPDGVEGAYQRRGETGYVLLDRSLDQAERNATLAHELVHEERGTLPAGAPDWLVDKEERHVDDEAARRLVPLEALDDLHLRAVVHGEQIALWEVAKQFGVTEAVAGRAVALWWAEQGVIAQVNDDWVPEEEAG